MSWGTGSLGKTGMDNGIPDLAGESSQPSSGDGWGTWLLGSEKPEFIGGVAAGQGGGESAGWQAGSSSLSELAVESGIHRLLDEAGCERLGGGVQPLD